MKCPKCGGQMGLEDAFCPYCGNPNSYAAQHQEEMKHYRKSYDDTQQEVLRRTKGFASYGAKLTLLVILLAANLAAIVLAAKGWDIGYSIREKNISAAADRHRANLEEYLADGDYAGFAGYMNSNGLSYTNDFDDLQAVYTAARRYQQVVGDLSDAVSESSYRFRNDYRFDNCLYLAKEIQGLYTIEQDYSYHREIYLSPENQAHIDAIRHRAELLLRSMLGLTEEQVASIPDLSERKAAELLEERISVLAGEEAAS